MVIRKDARAAEKTGEDDIHARGVVAASGKKIGGNDSKKQAKFKDVPHGTAEDGHGRFGSRQRITFPRYGLNESGLTGAIRAEDADMLAGRDFEQIGRAHV